MRFRIHHGATEIGGNCIEVESQGKTILLDLGLPLNAGEPDPRLLPSIPGLESGGNSDLLAIVISHPHADHYGLLAVAHHAIPVYLGEGANRLLNAASPFLGDGMFPQSVTTYKNREPFSVGPFRITPYLMDHSAYDAHALLIEADGRSLLYSGDFRGHGRKSESFEKFLADPPRQVDALLMEGTTLGRDAEEAMSTEQELEDQICTSIKDTDALVLACFSAQNIDRLVTFYKAARRSGRTLVIDAYTACIMDGLALKSLPSPKSPHSGIRVYLPKRQKSRIFRTKRFDLVEPYRLNRVYASEIGRDLKQWAMIFRTSMLSDAESLGSLRGSKLIYSLWSGYLSRDRTDLRAWCATNGVSLEVCHTSGHAHQTHMSAFAKAVGAKRVVPIHTVHPESYEHLMANVSIYDNGQWGVL